MNLRYCLVILFIHLFILPKLHLRSEIKINSKFLGIYSKEKRDYIGLYNTYDVRKGIYATSFLKDKKRRYTVDKIIDGRLDTCWATDVNGGIKEQILLFPDSRLDKGKAWYGLDVIGIGLYNGYCKSRELYYKNNRIKRIKIELYRIIPYPVESYKLRWYLDDKEIKLVKKKEEEIEDKYLKETKIYINFNLKKDFEKILKRKRITPDYIIVLTIEEIYKGTKYNDLCVSEIKFIYKNRREVNGKKK